jgi:hypothetical protein
VCWACACHVGGRRHSRDGHLANGFFKALRDGFIENVVECRGQLGAQGLMLRNLRGDLCILVHGRFNLTARWLIELAIGVRHERF